MLRRRILNKPTEGNIDGKYQVAANTSGQVYVSSDFGATWNLVLNTNTSHSFRDCSISENGMYISVTEDFGYLRVSSDYGATWTMKGYGNWRGISMSRSGQYQVAIQASSGYIYTSSDYGVNWTQRMAMNAWSCTVNANGQYALIGSAGYYLYGSSDYGVNWSSKYNLSTDWVSCDIDSSGQKQYAVRQSGAYGYLIESEDYGTNWSQKDGNAWRVIKVSDNAQYRIAIDDFGGGRTIKNTANFGSNWTYRTLPAGIGDIANVAISGGGQYQTVTTNVGYIVVSSDFGVTWTQIVKSGNFAGIAINKNSL